ncbi:MAG TPA: type II toxin-antitoxin system Phd/YefM family antitoxin [Rhodothermales bacterium]|nr:type II toxin-antitoxin system Phd/YefM family antitoxin [Rhodothermales bacterium]
MSISTGKARRAFSDVINRASYLKERVILTRHGKPVAAIVPIEDVEALEEAGNESGREFWVSGKRPTPEEVEHTLTELEALSRRQRLKGLSIREMIEEGRP